jgi:uncharacterized protein
MINHETKMKIAIAGASGFIGAELKKIFSQKNILVVPIPRELSSSSSKIKELEHLLSDCDIVVNLSGAPIIQRHTSKAKQIIYQSRINTTQNIVNAMSNLASKPIVFISTSAVGIYKPGIVHDEYSQQFNQNWVGDMCLQWEKQAFLAEQSGVRTVVMRLGVVIGRNGGVVQKLFPLFKMGAGAVILPPSASFPWVHVEDVASFVLFALENPKTKGVYNLTANNHTTQKDFAKAFARALKRPLLMVVPGLFLKILYGKGAEIITRNPFVTPQRLADEGFSFRFSDIHQTLLSEFRK